MGLSDWTELENLSGEIADSQSRLVAARSTQNHGLVKLLERQISEAEKWRDRLLQQITKRLTVAPGLATRHDPAPAPQLHQTENEIAEPKAEYRAEVAVAIADTAVLEPAPIANSLANRLEGVSAVWEQLTRADVERVKREFGVRRAELLTRHAEELRALDAEQTEIDTFEQAIDTFARKFNLAGAEVVVPFEERNSRGQARG
jgi:hypothetical protein